jgi:hypothetical protein
MLVQVWAEAMLIPAQLKTTKEINFIDCFLIVENA